MLTGLMAPVNGARFLSKNKGLIKYLAFPFAINSVIFSLFLFYVINWLPGVIGSFLPDLDGSLIRIVYYTLIILSYALILMISILCFSILGNIIASPFTDILTEKVEKIVMGTFSEETSFSIKDLMRIPWTMLEELKRICFTTFIFIVLLPLNLIPLIGQVLYLSINGATLALFLGLEFFSYSLDRKNYSFKQKLVFVKQKFLVVAGVGISTSILLFIPVINFCVLPLAAVGATLCFCGYEKKGMLKKED